MTDTSKIQLSLDDFHHLLSVYMKAIDIVNICYDDGKGWIGTENIKANFKFSEKISDLFDAILECPSEELEMAVKAHKTQKFLDDVMRDYA